MSKPNWPSPLRVHWACGGTYLGGFINVDEPGPNTHRFDAKGRAAPVPLSENYYWVGRYPEATTVDLEAAWGKYAFTCNTVDEFVCYGFFEKLSRRERNEFMHQLDYMVKPGGTVRVGTWSDAPFCMPWNTGEESIRELFERYCFTFVAETDGPFGAPHAQRVLHFRKPAMSALDPWPWQRHAALNDIPDDWRCLEIGPGDKAWPRANAVLDIVQPLSTPDTGEVDVVIGDLCEGTPWPDNHFDFVYCAHVLEHVTDPRAAVAEINRIAKAGLIEMPWLMKDALFAFHEDDHRWWVMAPYPGDDRVTFIKPNADRVKKLANRNVQGAQHRALRMGPFVHDDVTHLRRWFTDNHEEWNVIHEWTGELKIRVFPDDVL